MHKKFDSINLENGNQQQMKQGYGMMHYGNDVNFMISSTQGSHQQFNGHRPNHIQHMSSQQQDQQQQALMSPTGSSNGHVQHNGFVVNAGNHRTSNGSLNKSIQDIQLTNFNDSGGEAENQSTINSRSGSLSSSSSVNNNLILEEDASGGGPQQNNCQFNKNTAPVYHQHKNSIPDIIFTFSGDTTEDLKTDTSKDMSLYNDGYLSKGGQFELNNQCDLEMLSESVSLDNHANIINNQALYHQI